MKRTPTCLLYFIGLVLLSISNLAAQDSLRMVNPETSQNARLYNYTSTSINNVFNDQLRDSAFNRLTVDFDYEANSKELPASFGFNFIFKNDISDKLKNRVDGRINQQLHFEDYMKTGVTYQRYLKKWGASIFASWHHRQARNIRLNKEAFEVLFYGNARFENDTADLSDIRVQNFIYSQYTAGMKKTFDYGKYQMEFGAAVSFIQMINNFELNTNRTYIYTAADGEYIDINYDLSLNIAKEGATNWGQMNGAGASGAMHLAFMNRNKWKLAFDIADIGAFTCRKNMTNYAGANNVHFQGFVIPDLTTFSSQTFDTLNLDSAVRSYLPAKTANKYSMVLPFTINLAFSKPLLHDKLVLTAGLQYRHLPKYFVYGYLKANYFIRRDMVASISAGAGGYSLFNLGLEFSKSWKYFDFAIGSSNFIGLVAQSNYNGTSLYLRLGTSF